MTLAETASYPTPTSDSSILDLNIGSDQMAPSILTSGFVGEQENSHQHFSNMAICVEKLPYIM